MLRLLIPLFLIAAAGSAWAQAQFTEGPREGQLYPRDLVTNTAAVRIAGFVDEPGYQTASLLVMQSGTVYKIETTNLVYVNGVADFQFEPEIDAGLHRYRFRVFLGDGLATHLQGGVGDVLCGDAYLIQGQSNAVASDYHGQGLANHQQSTWIRSYGSAKVSANAALQDRNWYLADGETANGPGTVGAWGLRMARLLVDQYQVPVALLNGAVGATPIQWHLRDDQDPANRNTIYGRLLHRAQASGLAERARALIWYQGETNTNTAGSLYFSWFQMLRRDWLEDYPGLERIYLFQIREGCGTNGTEIREAQRQIADWFPEVSIMSTTAAPGHDGCHFHYEGYHELGNRISRLVARDLHLEPTSSEADPPNLWTARFGSPARDQIRLVGRDPAQLLSVDTLSYRWFQLNAPEQVLAVTVDGPDLLLQLDGPTAASHVAYVGHAGDGAWVTNSLGVGLLSFQLPIQP